MYFKDWWLIYLEYHHIRNQFFIFENYKMVEDLWIKLKNKMSIWTLNVFHTFHQEILGLKIHLLVYVYQDVTVFSVPENLYDSGTNLGAW